MGFGSPIHWIILGIIAIVLFGGGRFPQMMGDVAKGLKSFKKGMSDEEEEQQRAASQTPPATPQRPAQLQQQAPIEPNADHNLQPMHDDRPRQQ
jgi:sec-independent protein translocase protein TatA